MLKNVCCEGGGVKGLALCGAAQAFKEKGLWDNLQNFVGTSAGAIFALMASIGYSVDEIKDIMFEIDFSKFKDRELLVKQAYNFFKYYGLHSGNYFTGFIQDLIFNKFGKYDADFSDLKKLTGKGLFIIGSNLSTRASEVFCYENTPLMPLWKAVRISMSIPFYFKSQYHDWPVRDPYNENKEIIKPCLWGDGGIFLNYPIQFFDSEKFCKPDEYGHYINMESVGFKLDNADQIDVLKNHMVPTGQNITSVKKYVEAIIDSLMGAMDNYYRTSDDWKRTIFIDTLGIGTTQFNLSLKNKKDLFDSGYKSALEFLSGVRNV